jgi:hypothetical protein
MDGTFKEASLKRFNHYNHHQLRTQLADFETNYNLARRLRTFKCLKPYEGICKIWTSEPDRFIRNPIQQMPRLNT